MRVLKYHTWDGEEFYQKLEDGESQSEVLAGMVEKHPGKIKFVEGLSMAEEEYQAIPVGFFT